MLKLVTPTIFYKKKYYEYMKSWNDEIIVPVISDLRGRRFETLLKELYQLEHDTHVPKGFIPEKNYLIVDHEDEIIGFLNLRHYLNEVMLNTKGHIVYGVKPSARSEKVEKEILKIALEESKEIGIKEIKLVCNKANTSLCKFVLEMGGHLEGEGYNDVDRFHTHRYLFHLE
ncbi:MAG: hypothetical protein CVV63_04990 [Tenericutes bacterium HGW-Tenericutes-8]|nr:MAG: hypothetical protein CVV63_04990 [Tenericutes bacterium HGW-Tenericutes-8]